MKQFLATSVLLLGLVSCAHNGHHKCCKKHCDKKESKQCDLKKECCKKKCSEKGEKCELKVKKDGKEVKKVEESKDKKAK